MGFVKNKIAFIGLGVMGHPMAGHLSDAGHEVCVFNRTTARAEQWQNKYKGNLSSSPAAAVTGADVIFTCVGRDSDMLEVCDGEDGILSALNPGMILVDHTTTSASLARELGRRCRDLGAGFLDAPVSGGEQGARSGQLTIMCGGEVATFNKVEDILSAYARVSTLIGPVGSGQLCKMVNQICITGVIEGLAEGIHFAESAGLDVAQVMKVISNGAAQSWQMDNRHQSMINGEYNHGFAVDWMRKDLEIVLREARDNGAQLPLTAVVDQFYAEIQACGGGRWDTSSLLTRFRSATLNKSTDAN